MKRFFCILAVVTAPLLSHLTLARADTASGPAPLMPADTASGPAPVWRFWSPVLGRHFYTLNEAEKEKVLTQYADVWVYEGVAYRAFASGDDPNLMPVHRFWSEPLGSHFYTISEREKDKVINDYPDVWTYEGIVFYAYPAGRQPAGTLPIHRFWSGVLNAHFYTASDTEQFKTASMYPDVWQYEGIAWYAYPAESDSPVAIVKGPYLRQVTPDSTAILWETNTVADSRVDYGSRLPEEFSRFDPTPVRRHRVVLSGLDPNTRYTYRAASGGAAGPAGSFTTAPLLPQPFRFVVYGDSRSSPSVHAQVVQNMLDSAPALVFHTGDLVTTGRDYGVWQTEFFEPARELMRSVPLVPVLGNHEYGGAGPLWYFYFFDQPLDEGWWALTYGNVRFLGLDTDAPYTAGSPQHTWLLREFASAAYRAATWHIVIFHRPAFTCTVAYSDDMGVRDHLVPLFELYGVDVVFQGHSHTYERYRVEDIYYIVTGGGGGPLYDLRPDLVPPLRQFGLTVHHHCTVDVDPQAGTLTLQAIDITGRVFDTLLLAKLP
jgi:hypothetical protein